MPLGKDRAVFTILDNVPTAGTCVPVQYFDMSSRKVF